MSKIITHIQESPAYCTELMFTMRQSALDIQAEYQAMVIQINELLKRCELRNTRLFVVGGDKDYIFKFVLRHIDIGDGLIDESKA